MARKIYEGDIQFLVTTDGKVKYKRLASYWDEYLYMGQGKQVTEPNAVFTECMSYIGYGRGRSSAVAHFESEDCMLCAQMFLKDLDALILTGKPLLRVEGKWCYSKRGENYGLQYLGE